MTEDPYALPPTGFDLLIAEIVRNPNDPPTPIRICGIEYVTTSNRWAAFTNDELDDLVGALNEYCEPQPMDINPSYDHAAFANARRMMAEAEAEAGRRTGNQPPE